jgi:hypothetical protein
VSNDDGGSGGDDEGGGGGGGVTDTGRAVCAYTLIVWSLQTAGAIGISCPARPSTSLSWLLIVTTLFSRSVRKWTHIRM